MESTAVEADVVERVIPAGYIQLMFHYKNPFVVVEPKGTFIQQPRSVISGLSNTFSDVSTKGEAGVVFVSFRPAGACHFFDFPLSEIENLSIDLNDIFQSEISRVEEALYFAHTITEKVAVIEHFLLGRWAPIPNHDSLLINKGLKSFRKSRDVPPSGFYRIACTPHQRPSKESLQNTSVKQPGS